MKSTKLFILTALTLAMVACGGNKKPQGVAFNPEADSDSQMSDAEREARIAAKRSEYNAQNDVMSNIADFASSIKLTVMVPADDDISVAMQRQIENKLVQMVTLNGIGGLGGDPRYVLAPVAELQKKEVTSTAPVRHLVKYNITFYVADIITGTVFSSESTDVTGVGDSDELAVIAAFNELNHKDAKFQKMLIDAKAKIISYYQEHGADFIKQAQLLIAQQEYGQAMAVLGSIPVEAEEFYPTAVKMMGDITPKYIAKECGLALSQMKAALGRPTDENGYNLEAMQYYALIPNNSECKAEADALANQYKLDVANSQAKKEETARFNAELQAKIQMTANKCLLDKYKKDAAYNRLPWLRKLIHLGDIDPFDGYTPEKDVKSYFKYLFYEKEYCIRIVNRVIVWLRLMR